MGFNSGFKGLNTRSERQGKRNIKFKDMCAQNKMTVALNGKTSTRAQSVKWLLTVRHCAEMGTATSQPVTCQKILGALLLGIKHLVYEDQHAFPLTSKANNVWSCTSSIPHIYIAWSLLITETRPIISPVLCNQHSIWIYLSEKFYNYRI